MMSVWKLVLVGCCARALISPQRLAARSPPRRTVARTAAADSVHVVPPFECGDATFVRGGTEGRTAATDWGRTLSETHFRE